MHRVETTPAIERNSKQTQDGAILHDAIKIEEYAELEGYITY